ncbi:aspartate aminotransferase [Bradyrhizobium sp. CCBAU 45321]|nr:aspartate aminotransferase [Bradyrhizobium sp. CCBAU 45321]
MTSLLEKFGRLATDDAPGQEVRQASTHHANLLKGRTLDGMPVDFSHGDVDAFEPAPGTLEAFVQGVRVGGKRAYTEYRGDAEIRHGLAAKLERFTGAPVSASEGLMVTPGTQGALFLAIASTVSAGDKVAIVRPDYFANRKLVEFFGGEIVPVSLDYLGTTTSSGIDLSGLEDALRAGAKVFVFSNPNNPTGVIYCREDVESISRLAVRYGVTVIVDQLYARQIFDGADYWHLRAGDVDPDRIITIMGPSKTESLSGYRLGVAFGSPAIISRMEKLQAIVSLRAAGYSQSVLQSWFDEPTGWMEERIRLHQIIRDDLIESFDSVEGVRVRRPQGGSYLFPRLPKLSVSMRDFVRILRHQAAVTVTPGTEFSPHSDDSVRLNFSQARQPAARAVERVVQLVERYRA